MRRKRARRIDRETPLERFCKAMVHRLPCVGIVHIEGHVCIGDIEQSHERSIAKGSGLGVKLKATEVCSMCWGLAREWDVNQGPFDRWPKARRLEWMAERVAETKSVLLAAWERRVAQEQRTGGDR